MAKRVVSPFIFQRSLKFDVRVNLVVRAKVNKWIGIIRKLRSILPRIALLTIYKSFIRPNVDYCDFIYDQPHNESFCNNLEELQYNVALTITGAIKGTSKLKIYEELGLKLLKFRRRMCLLCVFL